jgi:hypothetical protein
MKSYSLNEALEALERVYDDARQDLLSAECEERADWDADTVFEAIFNPDGDIDSTAPPYLETGEGTKRYVAVLRNIVEISGVLAAGRSKNVPLDIDDLVQELEALAQFYDLEASVEPDGYFPQSIARIKTLWTATNDQPVFDSPKVIVPEIIVDANTALLEAIARDPALLRGVDPRTFEELVAEIFRKFKMVVHLTKRTRDGGIDIVAFEETCYTNNHYIIECKHYAPDRKVGLEVVQRLYGIKNDLRATKAFLVTSSSFSKDAIRFAKQHIWELSLKDHTDVVRWMQEFWRS